MLSFEPLGCSRIVMYTQLNDNVVQTVIADTVITFLEQSCGHIGHIETNCYTIQNRSGHVSIGIDGVYAVREDDRLIGEYRHHGKFIIQFDTDSYMAYVTDPDKYILGLSEFLPDQGWLTSDYVKTGYFPYQIANICKLKFGVLEWIGKMWRVCAKKHQITRAKIDEQPACAASHA